MPLPSNPTDAAPVAGDRSLIDSARELLAGLRGLLHDHLHLLALETQQAIQGLATIAAYCIVVGMLIGGTWLALAAAMVMWLVEQQVSSSAAMLVAAAFNALAVVGFAVAIQRKSRRIGLPATLQSLQPLPIDPLAASTPVAKEAAR